MKFSPYKDPAARDDWELFDNEDYVYDSDDSEDMEFPVHFQTSTSKEWDTYDRSTKYAVADALETKSLQVSKLESLINSWSSSQRSEAQSTLEKELQAVSDLLETIELENKAEDDARQAAFRKKNEEVARSVRVIVESEKQKQEQLRKQIEAAEQERLRQKALAEEAERRRVLEEEQKREKLKAAEEKAEEVKIAAQKAKDMAEAAEKRRKNALGSTPEEDAKYWKEKLESFKVDVLAPVSESKDLRNFCHRARLKINPRVGQVTNSIEQIGQVATGLKALFDEAATKDSRNLAQRWCLNFFCKAIVRQAEGEVMVKPTACYPLAFLAISLMKQYPDLKDIYLCRIAKKCPWTIPFVKYDKDTESGRKSLGWKRNSAGKYEDTTNYLERQQGIFRLWAATASLDLKSSPFPIENSWKFIARLLNSKIEDEELRNVAFAMVSSFMDIAGKTFLKIYGNQGIKMIRAIALWVGPEVRGANASRLRILVEEYVLKGKIGLDFDFER